MYKFDPKGQPVDVTFRAIAADQLGDALADLQRQDGDGRSIVHEARRRCKKLRGLLRLVRPAFAGYDKESAALRDAAAAFLDLLASRPAFARMALVEAPSSGERAFQLYASGKRVLQSLLDRGRDDPVEEEAIPSSAGRAALSGAGGLPALSALSR